MSAHDGSMPNEPTAQDEGACFFTGTSSCDDPRLPTRRCQSAGLGVLGGVIPRVWEEPVRLCRVTGPEVKKWPANWPVNHPLARQG